VDAGVDPHTETGEALLGRSQDLESCVAFAELEPDPPQADLLQKEQIVIREGPGVQAVGQLDIAGIILRDGWGAALRQKRADATGSPRRVFQKLTPVVSHRIY
jgi:hypothetical protein